MNPDEKADRLNDLWEEWKECDRCSLCCPVGRKRHNVVFGQGNPDARLMVVGEAAGEDEDLHGTPFWPDAPCGDMVQRMIDSFRSSRDEIFITNVVGCRPSQIQPATGYHVNREPASEEIAACAPRLNRIIEIVDPYVILMLGKTALQALTRTKAKISAYAENKQIPRVEVVTTGQCIDVRRTGFATWHPSYLLREGQDWREGGDIHLSWLTWQKAFAVSDMFAHIHRGDPLPDRERA